MTSVRITLLGEDFEIRFPRGVDRKKIEILSAELAINSKGYLYDHDEKFLKFLSFTKLPIYYSTDNLFGSYNFGKFLLIVDYCAAHFKLLPRGSIPATRFVLVELRSSEIEIREYQ